MDDDVDFDLLEKFVGSIKLDEREKIEQVRMLVEEYESVDAQTNS